MSEQDWSLMAAFVARIQPPCPRCRDPLSYVRNIPATDPAAELHIYMCDRCGNVVTREGADAPVHRVSTAARDHVMK